MDRQLAGLVKVARSNDTLQGAVPALCMTSLSYRFAIHFKFQCGDKVLAYGLELVSFILGERA
jgi:hypothetical protein